MQLNKQLNKHFIYSYFISSFTVLKSRYLINLIRCALFHYFTWFMLCLFVHAYVHLRMAASIPNIAG